MLEQGIQFAVELVFLLLHVVLFLMPQLLVVVVLVFRTGYHLDSTSYYLNEISWICSATLVE